ncbi:uncharacterized protein LOC135347555 [Halichondria panicea]|uniref:uncharacterized protein LOC135347555 n=1 Tax=Halichondria panicea TaxID=6063 RepID=UPI00312B3923
MARGNIQAHIDRDCLASAGECGNKCGVKVARGMVRSKRHIDRDCYIYIAAAIKYGSKICEVKVARGMMSEYLQKECRLQSFTCTVANCTFKGRSVIYFQATPGTRIQGRGVRFI